MIPVQLQPEPSHFDQKVRQPGLKWLQDKKIPLDQPPPKASDLPTLWRETQHDLWLAYSGTCAYLCIYFAWDLGAHSTDHFIAKSQLAGQTYEWSNFRLSCLGANRKKNKFDDVLDPFKIKEDTLILNLITGEISPNPELDDILRNKAEATIKRLHLDSASLNKMRADRFTDYLSNDVSERHLKKESPFVWHEAKRQGLL